METMRATLDELSTHAIEIDRDNRVLWMSRAALRANGLRLSEAKGRSIESLWPEEAASWMAAADAVRRSGSAATEIEYAETLTGQGMMARVTRLPLARGGVMVIAEDRTTALELAATQTMLRALTSAPLATLDTIGVTPRDLSLALRQASR